MEWNITYKLSHLETKQTVNRLFTFLLQRLLSSAVRKNQFHKVDDRDSPKNLMDQLTFHLRVRSENITNISSLLPTHHVYRLWLDLTFITESPEYWALPLYFILISWYVCHKNTFHILHILLSVFNEWELFRKGFLLSVDTQSVLSVPTFQSVQFKFFTCLEIHPSFMLFSFIVILGI